MRSLIIVLIFVLTLIPLLDSTAETEVVHTSQNPESLYVKFTEASWDSLDVIVLQTSDRRSHEVICSFNPWYGEMRSRIEFKNIYGIKALTIGLDDHACLELFNFIKIGFEVVHADNPILMIFDLKAGKIKKIMLPKLHQYERETFSPPRQRP